MLKTINPIDSMMNFHTRVLYTAAEHISSNPEELEKALFFASVYQSNCDELFSRESRVSPRLVHTYQQNLVHYNSTIRDIILHMREMDMFVTRDVDPAVFLQIYPLVHGENTNVSWYKTGELYYVTMRLGRMRIRVLSSTHAVYQHVFRDRKGEICKTDQLLLSFFQSMDQSDLGLVFRVTGEEDAPTMVHKVEYYGDKALLDQLVERQFRHTEMVVENPFLYLGDLQKVLHEHVKPKVEEVLPPTLTMTDVLAKDQLIEYPRQSFGNYLDLLLEASQSSLVKEIDITLYRIGSDPALLNVLEQAVKRGVEVHVHLEMKASGEDINELWQTLLSDCGVQLHYFHPGAIKVHAKLTLIKLKNGDRIAQIGTGNYHSKTTLQYTDLMLFTADHDICQQVDDIFDTLKGNGSIVEVTDQFLISMANARDTLVRLIDAEAEKGEDGLIVFKMNAMDDPAIIEHLSLAEEAGCRICLICRGLCTWLPNHIGEHVEVRSMIWDKLEHSRVYSFGSYNPTIYLGSMDLVEHKMDHRIETLCRVDDPDVTLQLISYLNRYVTGTENVWFLQEDGTYAKKEGNEYV